MPNPRIIELQCYILDLIDGGRLDFQMMPEVTISKSPNWNRIEIIGRSHPVLGYGGSAPKQYSFTLTFFAYPSKEDGTTIGQVSANLRFLESLAYPDYSGGIKPPHRCLIKLGQQTKMVGVISEVQINLKPLWSEGLPVHAEASVTFIEANEKPISYSVIRSSAGASS